MKNRFAVAAVVLAAGICSCGGRERVEDEVVEVEQTVTESVDTLLDKETKRVDGRDYLIFRPRREKCYVAMVDSVIPELGDSSVLLCVAGAFTGELLDKFKSTNIAGDYVIAGRRRRGYRCRVNTGVLYSDTTGKAVIAPVGESGQWYDRAVENKGWLVQQMQLLRGGKDVYSNYPVKRTSSNIYRAACVLDDGAFAIIQGEQRQPFGSFIAALQALGVSDALYLDMGTGWNYGWYRLSPQTPPQRLFTIRNPHQTNWITIKAK